MTKPVSAQPTPSESPEEHLARLKEQIRQKKLQAEQKERETARLKQEEEQQKQTKMDVEAPEPSPSPPTPAPAEKKEAKVVPEPLDTEAFLDLL